ncbi:hypothetical protein [Mesorhizobium sp.]|uniref:hypothetical protein n=1 Tax=Mesorhizobium sp. TaxID=1871066 RepID=UPI000FE8D32D|nr:hypothetical protein [Mesorhizobium sp.]RWM29388.1 MAG: hypothetical protein EOR74_06835 [Mesorhizobium sp.]
MGTAVRLLVLILALAGCVSTALIDDARKIWCDNNQPIRPSVAVFAVMTRPELDDMNALNAKGVEWCHWRP